MTVPAGLSAPTNIAATPIIASGGATNITLTGTNSATVGTNAPISNSDPTALYFMETCAGCHTIGDGKLTGPDLREAGAWQKSDIKLAIKKMEQKVGPMQDALIESMADFLKDAEVKTRLKNAREEIARRYAVSMDPASEVIGRALFEGERPLKNGGTTCVACHSVNGLGPSLGPDLKNVFTKMGSTPLISAIEKSSFKVMEPVFRNHPITKQEALHLAKYLEKAGMGSARDASTPVILLGSGGAMIFILGMGLMWRQCRFGHRETPQRRKE